MGLIKNVRSAISQWNYERKYKKALDDLEYELKRMYYDAASPDRLNSGWQSVVNLSGEKTDDSSRDFIRAKGRDLERNSDAMGGIISAFERNVVKDGITLQAKTDDEALNAQIEDLWKKWCKPRNCDVTGSMSFTEIELNIVRRKFIDGGILIHKTYTGELVPFQIQLLEVDELDGARLLPKVKGNTVVGGVEINRYRKPVGYWIKQYNPDGTESMESRFIDAQHIIFYMRKTRPSQIREISTTANMITRIRDIDSYMEAVGVKERIAACLAVFITKTDGKSGYGRGFDKVDQSSGYPGKSITPGMIQELAPGEDVKAVTPPAQGSSAADYVRLAQRMAGSGIGLAYESISRDMSQVNYSSARQGLIEDEGSYAIEQEALVSHVLDEVYSEFLISAVLCGEVEIKDFWENKDNYLEHQWLMPGRKWIDPLKEASANKIAIQTGQLTLAQVVGAQGKDWREQIDEIAMIQEYAKQKGVDISGQQV